MQLTHSQQQDTMALPQSPATNHQKITSQDLQVGISFCLCCPFLNILTFLVQQGLENKMDQDFLQLIIKAMRLPCSMQHMLTYITNPDLKPHKWAEEVCPETKPVTAVKADLNPVLAVISVAAAAATAVVVSISVGPVVRLNSFITVKFVKFLAPVSKKLLIFANFKIVPLHFRRSTDLQRPLGWTKAQEERGSSSYRSSYGNITSSMYMGNID